MEIHVARYVLENGQVIYFEFTTKMLYVDKYIQVLSPKYIDGKHFFGLRSIYENKKGMFFRFNREEIYINEMEVLEKASFKYDLQFNKDKIDSDYLKAFLHANSNTSKRFGNELVFVFPILTLKGNKGKSLVNTPSDEDLEVSFEEEYDKRVKNGERVYIPCKIIEWNFYHEYPGWKLEDENYMTFEPQFYHSEIVDQEYVKIDTIIELLKKGYIQIL